MTNDEIIVRQELARVYPQLLINVQKVCGDGADKWADDLLAVIIEEFLNKPIDKQLDAVKKGKLEHFITKMMKLALVWNSHFYRKYRRPVERNRELFDNYSYLTLVDEEYKDYSEVTQTEKENQTIDCMIKIIEQYDPFLKEVARTVLMQGYSIKTVSKKYKINYYQIKEAIKVIQEDLKIHCSHCLKEE